MKLITSLAGAKARLRASWQPALRQLPLVLLTFLVVALAVPAGLVIAPAFTGQGLYPEVPAPSTPSWQQSPVDLSQARGVSQPGGIAPLNDTAPIPTPEALASQLNATLKADGAGTFTGLVQD